LPHPVAARSTSRQAPPRSRTALSCRWPPPTPPTPPSGHAASLAATPPSGHAALLDASASSRPPSYRALDEPHPGRGWKRQAEPGEATLLWLHAAERAPVSAKAGAGAKTILCETTPHQT
jgi:hypothetical protein